MEFKWEEFAHGQWANAHGYSLRHYLKAKSGALLSIHTDTAMVFCHGVLVDCVDEPDEAKAVEWAERVAREHAKGS